MKTLAFNELPLSPEILRAVADMGFEEATPIQSESIPHILEGRDMLGQAQTGTGKTCAFGIPIIERVDRDDNHIQYLILAPTRELAIQIADEMHEVAKYKEGIRILAVYGGQPIDRQILALKKRPQIIVGTPGRVMDHMRRKTLRLDNLSGIILDEADEMLNMGFKEDIDTILVSCPDQIQKVYFSATMPKAILELTEKYLHDPIHVRIAAKQLAVDNISQHYIEVRESNKLEVLCRLIEADRIKLALIFCNTKRKVDEVCEKLATRGYSAEALHGDMKQPLRTRVMNRFRSGEVDLLIATDVAARGIDVDNIEVVINYDLPQDEEYYVHRIGRTGRAGRSGKAYTFVVGREIIELKNIQHYAKANIVCVQPPSLSDVTESRVTGILEELRDGLAADDLAKYVEAIEQFAESLNVESPEGDYFTTADIAAALLRQAMGVAFHQAQEIEPVVPYLDHMARNNRYNSSYNNSKAGFFTTEGDSDRQARSAPKSRGGKKMEPGMTRLFINVGSDDNVLPQHIVKSICSRSSLTGRQIGAIAIYGRYTFADVPDVSADEVIANLTNTRINDRVVRVEKGGGPKHGAESEGESAPRSGGYTKKPYEPGNFAKRPRPSSPSGSKSRDDKKGSDRRY
ncbi:MAG: DEAD/DEAH box helicase [Eubacteriales bacterium]|nr:DEAD/DEAH box helicase [Eubacteriales bacterium]